MTLQGGVLLIESVATKFINAGETGELAEGALTESLLSDGGKCRGEGEDVGEVLAAHERLRREINQVVREAEVRASEERIYGWSRQRLHSAAEGCTVRQATLRTAASSAARNSPCAAARQNVLAAAKLARLGASSVSAISTINSSGRDAITQGS